MMNSFAVMMHKLTCMRCSEPHYSHFNDIEIKYYCIEANAQIVIVTNIPNNTNSFYETVLLDLTTTLEGQT